MPMKDTNFLMGKVIHKRYKVGERIAAGAFGAFHHCTDLKNPERKVGIKIESNEEKDGHLPLLNIENKMYRQLNEGGNVPKFIPKIFCYEDAITVGWAGLVMEFLGPSLRKMANLCGGTFSIATTTQLLWQLTNMMEYVHDRKILYRDVKPENFILGLPKTDRWCTVMLIDLGFAKKYVDDDNKHIKWNEDKPLAGTMRYASASNQQGHEIGRHDDLEALLYMAVYLFKRDLPWEHEGKEIANDRERNRAQAEMKKSIDPKELCSDMPRQFAQYLTMVRQCGFEERPPYRKLIGLLRDVLTHLGLTIEEEFYDWDEDHKPIPVELRS